MPMSIPTQQVETEGGEKWKIILKKHQKFSPAYIDKAFSLEAFNICFPPQGKSIKVNFPLKVA